MRGPRLPRPVTAGRVATRACGRCHQSKWRKRPLSPVGPRGAGLGRGARREKGPANDSGARAAPVARQILGTAPSILIGPQTLVKGPDARRPAPQMVAAPSGDYCAACNECTHRVVLARGATSAREAPGEKVSGVRAGGRRRRFAANPPGSPSRTGTKAASMGGCAWALALGGPGPIRNRPGPPRHRPVGCATCKSRVDYNAGVIVWIGCDLQTHGGAF